MLVPARLGPGFRPLLASSWTSNLGDGVAARGRAVAPSPPSSASPAVVALAATLRWTPPLLFGLGAGVLTDRLDRRRRRRRRRTAPGSPASSGLVVTLVTGTATVGLVLGAPRPRRARPRCSPTARPAPSPRCSCAGEDLPLATARLTTGFITLDQLAGPPIGAALFAAGRVWPFVGEAVLLVAAVALLTRVVGARLVEARRRRARTTPSRSAPTASPPARAAASAATSPRASRGRWRHPAVRTLALTILVFNVTFGAAWAVLVLYVHQRLGLGAVGFGGCCRRCPRRAACSGPGLLRLDHPAREPLRKSLRVGLVLETLAPSGSR